jgi:TRAP-type C4-dicarboxylate transport system permease small subunit
MNWSKFDRWWLSAWIFPVISACMWLGMLLAMFCTWEVQGHKHLPSMSDGQNIAYISDIGAFGLKPLFITGAVITTIFLDLSFMSERWLRHYGRLAPNTSKVQSTLSAISIFFAIAGTCGLIFLSIFDTYHHHKVHDGCLFLFIAGYIISAIFLCAEYQRLGIHYRQHRILRISFWIKLMFIIVEFCLAISFAVCSWKSKLNVSAVLEWIGMSPIPQNHSPMLTYLSVSLIFTFYVLSFLLDLWPSVRSKHHTPQGWHEQEARLEKDAERQGGLTSFNEGPEDGMPANADLPNGGNRGYRGTDLTRPASHLYQPREHNDLGRKKKWGIF